MHNIWYIHILVYHGQDMSLLVSIQILELQGEFGISQLLFTVVGMFPDPHATTKTDTIKNNIALKKTLSKPLIQLLFKLYSLIAADDAKYVICQMN